MARQSTPDLPFVDPHLVTSQEPRQRVHGEAELASLSHSVALSHVSLVISRCSDAVVGIPCGPESHSNASEMVQQWSNILDALDRWIDEIPLDTDPQRFGNLAFRVWGARLESSVLDLHDKLIPQSHETIKIELLHHFVRSFGNWTRLDYGTGHELSFISYLSILLLTRLARSPEDESSVVTVLFSKYLDVCRKLQRVYRLEPAGSKGAYGLDDFFHIAWIWGAAQLRGHPTLRPNMILSPQNTLLPLASTHLLPSLLSHVLTLKTGPFSHHSPLLNSISSTVPHFAKMESGLGKMWNGEVVGKWPVVQHWWLTDRHGVLTWVSALDGKDLPDRVPTREV